MKMYNYWCSNINDRDRCEFCNSKGDLQIKHDSNDLYCAIDKNVKLKLMGRVTNVGINVGKFKKGRGKVEGRKRSQDHFKKEIYPTLAKSDKKYFAKKYNIKDK